MVSGALTIRLLLIVIVACMLGVLWLAGAPSVPGVPAPPEVPFPPPSPGTPGDWTTQFTCRQRIDGKRPNFLCATRSDHSN
jgi:hypothetical protein